MACCCGEFHCCCEDEWAGTGSGTGAPTSVVATITWGSDFPGGTCDCFGGSAELSASVGGGEHDASLTIDDTLCGNAFVFNADCPCGSSGDNRLLGAIGSSWTGTYFGLPCPVVFEYAGGDLNMTCEPFSWGPVTFQLRGAPSTFCAGQIICSITIEVVE